jgi:hypothetical protein
MNVAKQVSEYWFKLSFRQRCTAQALCSMLAGIPIVVTHLWPTFEPFVMQGGSVEVRAWIGLVAIYYVWIRSCIDLLTDCVDIIRNEYSLKGGDIRQIPLTRSNIDPHDNRLTVSDLERDRSRWQYALIVWTAIESATVSIVVGISVLAAVMGSPYLHPDNSPDAWVDFMYGLMYGCGLYSVTGRNYAGVMPLPLRWLGLPNFYPGQIAYPHWLNKLLMKVLGRR